MIDRLGSPAESVGETMARTRARDTAKTAVDLTMIVAGLIIMITGHEALPMPLTGVGLSFLAVGARERRRSTG